MSFNLDGGGTIGSEKNCKPDYEKQASEIKKQMDDIEFFRVSLMAFMNSNFGYRFSKISSIAELLGGVVFNIEELTKSYERTLELIEKE